MCFFNTGWIAGVFEAVYDKQRYYFDVAETSCEAVKGKGCKYNVEVR
jgi:predicted hydrocarbon binding protein